MFPLWASSTILNGSPVWGPCVLIPRGTDPRWGRGDFRLSTTGPDPLNVGRSSRALGDLTFFCISIIWQTRIISRGPRQRTVSDREIYAWVSEA